MNNRELRRIFLFLVLCSVSAAGQSPAAGSQRKDLAERLQTRFTELRAEAGFPGVNIAVITPNGRATTISIGTADLENKTGLRPQDRMLAGSIGKTFVSAVTLKLVETGALKLDQKIETWLGREPWFSRLPNARDITLRMLMNHSSGVPEHVLHKDFLKALREQPDKVWKPEELVAYILDAKPLFEAGKGWSYADTNYILVGMIFERVTGKTVYGEIARQILNPLHLNSTSPSDSRTLSGLIPGYVSANSPFGFSGRTLIEGKFIVNPQMEWCGGGFVSTAEDLARWAQALYGGDVLNATTLSTLLDAVPAKTAPGDQYGLGVQVRQSDWGMSYGHGGWFPGYLSEMEYFPQRKTAIALQFNTDDFGKLKRRPHSYLLEAAKIVISE
jgi:D-alanyl-D-alanine carboxypeptidase